MPLIAWGVLLLLAVGFALLLRPLPPPRVAPPPRPAASYGEALRLVDAIGALDSPAVAPECRTKLLTHGARTRRVIVFLHGLTNCPAQFDSLGQLCYERGANVLIPRLPHHGLADRMTAELAHSDARELVEFTARVMDAAAGLGDSVTVVGLSVGGVLAAWAGQARSDVDRAVIIAPLLAMPHVRGPLLNAATRLMLALPNAFFWWDPRRREDLPGPRHVYPRFATRAVAATVLVGAAVRESARHSPPGFGSAAVIAVGGDRAVDNGAIAALVRAWRARGARDLTTYEFPKELHLNHDIVDPDQVNGNPALTYPVLLERICP